MRAAAAAAAPRRLRAAPRRLRTAAAPRRRVARVRRYGRARPLTPHTRRTLAAHAPAMARAKATAEANAVKFEGLYNALKASAGKDVEIAILKAKMQGGLLMLQRAEAAAGAGTSAGGGAGGATPGPGGASSELPTPTALQQFFSVM